MKISPMTSNFAKVGSKISQNTKYTLFKLPKSFKITSNLVTLLWVANDFDNQNQWTRTGSRGRRLTIIPHTIKARHWQFFFVNAAAAFPCIFLYLKTFNLSWQRQRERQQQRRFRIQILFPKVFQKVWTRKLVAERSFIRGYGNGLEKVKSRNHTKTPKVRFGNQCDQIWRNFATLAKL